MPASPRPQALLAKLLAALLCGMSLTGIHAAASSSSAPYLETLSKVAPGDQTNPVLGIPGDEGWLFFGPELRHLNRPQGGAGGRSKALGAILDFHTQLTKAGIRLLVVPVPAKASIYPEKLAPGLTPPSQPPFIVDKDFCSLLQSNGVPTLDLTATYLDAKTNGIPLYCRTDSHWSPEGIRIAASEIASRIKGETGAGNLVVETTPADITLHGDLSSPTDEGEHLTLRTITAGGHPIPTPRESPVLLLGDSHNLVFHSGGEMHAEGAGLPDALAAELGMPVDVVAVMGSGATAARRSLARRKDNLTGKRVVVWCFSARDLTEAPSWDKVPVIRP